MTLNEIASRRQRITDLSSGRIETMDPPEIAANKACEQLWYDTLAAIANGAPDAAELARAAMKRVVTLDDDQE